MEANQKVDAFFTKHAQYSAQLTKIRKVLLQCGQTETVKWGMPTYTIDGKNVTGIGAFKNHFGVWFFQGALLSDEGKKLTNAQEGKTAAMRQWRFEANEEIDVKLLKQYVQEAVKNQEKGLKVPTKKPIKKAPVDIPILLAQFLTKSKKQLKAFEDLTPGKQREYIEYINEAKREATKLSRLEKIGPMILAGVGLNDKYK